MSENLVNDIIKNKAILAGVLGLMLVSGAFAVSNSASPSFNVGKEITYQDPADPGNYMTLNTEENTFEIHQDGTNEPLLTGSYTEFSDKYVLAFDGLPVSQASMKVDGGIQAIRADGSVGSVWKMV